MRRCYVLTVLLFFQISPTFAAGVTEAELQQHSWCFVRAGTTIVRMQFLSGGSLNQGEYTMTGTPQKSYVAEWKLETADGGAKLTRSFRDSANRGNRIIVVNDVAANPDKKSLSLSATPAVGGKYVFRAVICDGEISDKIFQ